MRETPQAGERNSEGLTDREKWRSKAANPLEEDKSSLNKVNTELRTAIALNSGNRQTLVMPQAKEEPHATGAVALTGATPLP